MLSEKSILYHTFIIALFAVQKRHWEELGHVKPSILDRDRERNLQRIATK